MIARKFEAALSYFSAYSALKLVRCLLLLSRVTTFLLFSCNIIQVDNYGWNLNGTWNGAMGLFQRKRIQALSHATIMREDRLKYVEFTGEVFVIE